VNLVAIGELLVERGKERIHTALPHVAAFVRRKRRPRTDVERAFRAMCARGVESLLVLGFSDGGLDMVARYLGHDARRMRGYTNFEMLVLDDADHTFTSLKAQEKLRWILAEYMSTRFR
jgi:thiamine pyrophosphokinase